MKWGSNALGTLLCLALLMPAGCRPVQNGDGGARILPSCDEAGAQVCWPRFPPSGESRQIPRLAVFLSTGEINQNTTLARLGYPDRQLFRLHRNLPRLKVVLVGSPANRYSGERDVTQSPEGASTWKALAADQRFEWLEIGGGGYTHSPPGDTHLDHHEFDPGADGCNLDHARMAAPEYCREQLGLARRAYAKLGFPGDGVEIIRFPGMSDNPAALAAATEAGFIAILGNRHPQDAGKPQWISHPSGEILDLENTKLTELAAALPRLDKLIAQGGVLNLRAELQDLFSEEGKTTSAYELLTATIRSIEDRYGTAVWYPKPRDLARWLDLCRHAKVSVSAGAGAIELQIEPPASWAAAGRILDEAAIAVRVPADWDDVAGVSVSDTASASWFWAGPRLVVVPFAARGPVRVRVSRR